jgi:hypothetical protein
MEETKVTLGASMQGEIKADPNSLYMVDFDKVKTPQDLITIFACIGFTFSGTHPHIDMLLQYLDLSRPIPNPNQPAQPEKKSLDLPKIKKID